MEGKDRVCHVHQLYRPVNWTWYIFGCILDWTKLTTLRNMWYYGHFADGLCKRFLPQCRRELGVRFPFHISALLGQIIQFIWLVLDCHRPVFVRKPLFFTSFVARRSIYLYYTVDQKVGCFCWSTRCAFDSIFRRWFSFAAAWCYLVLFPLC